MLVYFEKLEEIAQRNGFTPNIKKAINSLGYEWRNYDFMRTKYTGDKKFGKEKCLEESWNNYKPSEIEMRDASAESGQSCSLQLSWKSKRDKRIRKRMGQNGMKFLA